MKDFIYVDSWFEKKYKEKSDSRYFTFKTALNLLLQTGGKNIVETGTTRMKDDYGAGYSTYIFGDFAKRYGRRVWTVDISPENIKTCKEVTSEFSDVIDYTVADSHLFLENFAGEIDLLYLDSVDFPLDGSDPIFCQEHQLKELKIAQRRFGSFPIVLLDDNSLPNGGKTKLTKEYLEKEGWICLADGQQSLWIR